MNRAVEIFETLKAATHSLFKKTEEIQELLNSKDPYDIRDGLNAIFENMGQGRDFSFYLNKVINLVANDEIEIKRLAAIIISEYSHKNPDISLLCISTLQRGITNKNQLIRALSLRTLLHLDSDMFYQIQYQAIVNTISNSSSYVKRISCLGLPTLIRNSSVDDQGAWLDILGQFMGSESNIVFGTSLMILYFYFPDHLYLLHKYFHKLCENLMYMDELHIPLAVELLTMYSRTYFCDQTKQDVYSDSDTGTKMQMDKDFEFLLYSCLPLLSHRSSAVVMSVARLVYYCAPRNFSIMIVQPIIRVLTTKPFLTAVTTHNIDAMIMEMPNVFENYLDVFFVRIHDDMATKTKKLDILVHLINDKNHERIFKELEFYVRYPQFNFAKYAIRKLVNFSKKRPESIEPIMDMLLLILKSNRSSLVSECVVVLRQMLQVHARVQNKSNSFNLSNLVSKLIIIYSRLSDPLAKESIIWIVTEHYNDLVDLVPDMLRLGTKNFAEEENNVKYQLIMLVLRMQLSGDITNKKLQDHVFKLAKYDQNYNIRDTHRFLNNLKELDQKGKLSKSANNTFFNVIKPTATMSTFQINRGNYELMTLSNCLEKPMVNYRNLPVVPDQTLAKDLRNNVEKVEDATQFSSEEDDTNVNSTPEEEEEEYGRK